MSETLRRLVARIKWYEIPQSRVIAWARRVYEADLQDLDEAQMQDVESRLPGWADQIEMEEERAAIVAEGCGLPICPMRGEAG